MKKLNWLIKAVFYKHREEKATIAKTTHPNAIFYDVGFIDQVHGNLCTNASENMIYHFAGKPISTMIINPRGPFAGSGTNQAFFDTEMIDLSAQTIKTKLSLIGPFLLHLPLRYNAGHTVVVVGLANQNIIYHDPLTGSNKFIPITRLSAITGNFIQIATAKAFLMEHINLASIKKTVLNENPKNIIPKNYQSFFSLEKMEDPCKAIIDFLSDYCKFSLFSNRTHKREVLNFINELQEDDKQNLDRLLTKLANSFQANPLKVNGELTKRFLTIKQIVNKPHLFENENPQSNLHF